MSYFCSLAVLVSMGENVGDGLQKAERMVKMAFDGLKQFEDGEGENRIRGLMNAVSAGRNVTWVLQKNLSDVEGFDEWYANCQRVLKEDEVCSQMIEIRNGIVKEGDEGVTNYGMASVTGSELMERMPPWADELFIGDQYGGSGYVVKGPDGERSKIYRDFPDLDVETGLYFDRLNDIGVREFDSISDAGDDLRYYVRLMLEIVKDAERQFG